jgi:hypothetical protein
MLFERDVGFKVDVINLNDSSPPVCLGIDRSESGSRPLWLGIDPRATHTHTDAHTHFDDAYTRARTHWDGGGDGGGAVAGLRVRIPHDDR